ncbi:uncharacterized protein LOC117512296 [Thalassophryne amazonica]|uniref:uncharacterized protein LOC117512296 n=1 Tax=Thalassophryne amazonica TaxID=390379 RepID=UPI0014720129|nr:uncharacterized protein LOC117512296 [Thalassophryne amazonica]XP_034028202.1 uncharacterized protein LOC117512296 [Thalassophryne amazonica]
MDSSSVLRQKSQNRIQIHNHMSTNNDYNKMPTDTKPSKQESGPNLTSHNVENLDPKSSEVVRKAPVRPGMSRLPVLAKSLHLQTPSDFSQSHCRWEEKPLTGKAKNKKPCTRPIPFHLSQPRGTRTTSEKKQLQSVTRSTTGTNITTKNINANTRSRLATLNGKEESTKVGGKTPRKDQDTAFHVSEHCESSGAFKTSATLSHPLTFISETTVCPKSAASCAQPALSTEVCLDNMNLLSLKEPSKACNVQEVTTSISSQGKL